MIKKTTHVDLQQVLILNLQKKQEKHANSFSLLFVYDIQGFMLYEFTLQ